MQKTNKVKKLCENYGISEDNFRAAAVAELMAVGFDQLTTDSSLDDLIENVAPVMDDNMMVSTIKWATWHKHANEHSLPGAAVAELINLRKEEANAIKDVQKANEAATA